MDSLVYQVQRHPAPQRYGQGRSRGFSHPPVGWHLRYCRKTGIGNELSLLDVSVPGLESCMKGEKGDAFLSRYSRDCLSFDVG